MALSATRRMPRLFPIAESGKGRQRAPWAFLERASPESLPIRDR